MSATSRHLTATAKAVRAGAHVLLRGHLHDEVLLAGSVTIERWALNSILVDEAGMDAVVLADAAGGLRCLDEGRREAVEQALASTPAEEDSVGNSAAPRLGNETGLGIATAALALMRQREMAVAVILDDLDLLVDVADQQGRGALGLLRRAVDEAECCPDASSTPRRNVLVLLADRESRAADDLASLPGVRTIDATAPDRTERAVTLGGMASGFYGVEQADAATTEGLDVLADGAHGWSLRELEQLRRLSHDLEIPPTRPGTLLAAMPSRPAVSPIARVGLETVMDALEQAVVGQPSALLRLRLGLEQAQRPSALRPRSAPPSRPLMTAVMFGPTGVGKTEVARTLARVLFGSERALVRIDCAELQGPHDLARLTGAPPGYVGHDAGGALSEPLRRRPGSVVLFDEFEKADSAFGELLLSILDDGRLTDGRGETVSFGGAIVLITTNLGSDVLKGLIARGLPSTPQLLELSAVLAAECLSTPPKGRPELWSRLQHATVGFDVLRREALSELVGKYCTQIEANLADELDVRLRIRADGFAAACRERVGPDGTWDGRTIANALRMFVERPVRAQLQSADLGQSLVAEADPLGFAVVRAMREIEPAA